MADWYDRVRGNYQTAMDRPSEDFVTMLLRSLGAPVQRTAPSPPMFPPPSRPPDADLALPTMAPAVLPQRPVSDADYALPTMAPPPVRGPLAPPQPVPAAARTVPAVTVQAPAMDPRTVGDADLAGYGVSPRPADYSHLNPTPGLEEIYRREYAANPNGFTPGRLFGLFG